MIDVRELFVLQGGEGTGSWDWVSKSPPLTYRYSPHFRAKEETGGGNCGKVCDSIAIMAMRPCEAVGLCDCGMVCGLMCHSVPV